MVRAQQAVVRLRGKTHGDAAAAVARADELPRHEATEGARSTVDSRRSSERSSVCGRAIETGILGWGAARGMRAGPQEALPRARVPMGTVCGGL